MSEDDAPTDDQSIADRLGSFDTCTISDALDTLGLTGAVIGLAPLTIPGRRIAGEAVTVKLGPPLAGLPKRHLCAAAVMSARNGEVIVIEHRGRADVSGWGGLLSRGAIKRGVAGVIIDGACRDVDESRELGLPIFGRNAVPVTARGRIAEHAWDCPVTIGTVVVKPGDWVVADGSGVVFVDPNRLNDVLREAERISAREAAMALAIEAGSPLDQVLGANYEDLLNGAESNHG
ncbi:MULTISPECIES: RraA family protein [Novosphingobium]|jgi:regulator of RNase E activity RraA|uniref:Putative 4-hydroxy-4-methyl-2-oxoglutarate aldolase n=1 Tax=Novosphingobium subterraneum TaxID=48936 RepID=A0A0B8ZYX3_9SPHN|nr:MULTISPECIES: dimethylmenaquinone methyltransferase [Novosphingobium]KHS42348.1 dimethylmenaquinone methyltransferase [Novosphingobium subterraneum]QOV96689.1 RraA family protein [Novosphingobium sp. ES2-1]